MVIWEPMKLRQHWQKGIRLPRGSKHVLWTSFLQTAPSASFVCRTCTLARKTCALLRKRALCNANEDVSTKRAAMYMEHAVCRKWCPKRNVGSSRWCESQAETEIAAGMEWPAQSHFSHSSAQDLLWSCKTSGHVFRVQMFQGRCLPLQEYREQSSATCHAFLVHHRQLPWAHQETFLVKDHWQGEAQVTASKQFGSRAHCCMFPWRCWWLAWSFAFLPHRVLQLQDMGDGCARAAFVGWGCLRWCFEFPWNSALCPRFCHQCRLSDIARYDPKQAEPWAPTICHLL